jgi:predicted enzyme related to lactoylglutathione lyase
MTTSPFTEMERLGQDLAAEPSGVETKLTTFQTGSAMLDVRRNGQAFVMAYTPTHGFGVDELHADDGFVTAYRFVFTDFDSAARQLKTLLDAPVLSLVVLQSGNIEAARDFFSLLGLAFTEEKHGQGPRHYAAQLGSLVLEIYPCQGSRPASPIRLGFRVPCVDKTVEMLHGRGVRIVSEAKDSPWGRRAVVEDPDGNRVELSALG